LAQEFLDDNLWFKLGEYNFYYGKIDNCVYIFDNELKLFFYFNRNDCSFRDDKLEYIAICLNHPEITDEVTYNNLLDTVQEYKPFSKEVNIFKQIGNINFNLVNGQISQYFSEVKLNSEILSEIKNIYNIPVELNLLIFKGDIRRSDTISTQVEYQFYNPIPNKIYEKINFSKLNISLRNLDTDHNIIKVNLSLPIYWSHEQFNIIKDLYYKHQIFIFDSNNPFYLDVCYKFKNSNNSDVYLEDRKKRYFINEAICEEGCNLVDAHNYYDIYDQTSKLVCQCPLKMILDNYTKIKFAKNEKLDEGFKKKFTYPNFRMIICFRTIFSKENIKNNILFYFTLFGFIIFQFLFLFMLICKSHDFNQLDKIKKLIKEFKNTMKKPEEIDETAIKKEEIEEIDETNLKKEENEQRIRILDEDVGKKNIIISVKNNEKSNKNNINVNQNQN